MKPRLAVTTRTLEAIIRLATAHAKLKLRKDDVLEEDVEEAYRLMLAAREEEVAALPSGAMEVTGEEDGPAPPGDGDEPVARRSQKRSRAEAEAADGEEGSITITAGRLSVLTTLVARTFARQTQQEVPRLELLEAVNAGLVQGENPFSETEFFAGMDSLEAQNKIMMVESGNVIHIG
mmetsp:Transcript_7657/g.17564  ORF Transcript_7657/g.17564 Transcript_7657/m.17564 type:complete len:178 (-) Transcript_7657:1-534(-)